MSDSIIERRIEAVGEYHDGELFEHRDGQMVELDQCMAGNPFDGESVAELVNLIPRSMLPEVARLVMERVVGSVQM